jgi:hypothetical protein
MNPRFNPFPMELHFDNAGYFFGKRLIEVTRPFPVTTSLGCFTVPAGTISDGASIPAMAQAIVGHPLEEFLEDDGLGDLFNYFPFAHFKSIYINSMLEVCPDEVLRSLAHNLAAMDRYFDHAYDFDYRFILHRPTIASMQSKLCRCVPCDNPIWAKLTKGNALLCDVLFKHRDFFLDMWRVWPSERKKFAPIAVAIDQDAFGILADFAKIDEKNIRINSPQKVV